MFVRDSGSRSCGKRSKRGVLNARRMQLHRDDSVCQQQQQLQGENIPADVKQTFLLMNTIIFQQRLTSFKGRSLLQTPVLRPETVPLWRHAFWHLGLVAVCCHDWLFFHTFYIKQGQGRRFSQAADPDAEPWGEKWDPPRSTAVPQRHPSHYWFRLEFRNKRAFLWLFTISEIGLFLQFSQFYE